MNHAPTPGQEFSFQPGRGTIHSARVHESVAEVVFSQLPAPDFREVHFIMGSSVAAVEPACAIVERRQWFLDPNHRNGLAEQRF